jgi:ribosomal protein S18 acetylase RimI-like enzyme
MNRLIRFGNRADVPLLGAIERAAGQLFPAGRIPDPDSCFPVSLLAQAADRELLFVVEVAGTVVGFATCTPVAGRLHLDELSVHPDHGRRGHGRALVETVIDAARTRGLDGVSLTTFADIPWNGPFYASMGFETIAEAALDAPLTEALTHERAIGLSGRVAMY